MSTILVISPHLDDACLSFGASLAESASSGHRVFVYTVFAGIPQPPYSALATRFHQVARFRGDPITPRRLEDRLAMSHLGAIALHGDYLDAIYRRRDDLRWLIREGDGLQTRYASDEPGMLNSITQTVEQLIVEHKPGKLITSAAIGSHVDHHRARDATIAAARRTRTPLFLWEDLPYALQTTDMPRLPPGTELGELVAIPSNYAAKQAKYRAIECYRSQLRLLEYEGTDVLSQLDRRFNSRSNDADGYEYAEFGWDVKPLTNERPEPQ